MFIWCTDRKDKTSTPRQTVAAASKRIWTPVFCKENLYMDNI
jgi:hypothetical protein